MASYYYVLSAFPPLVLGKPPEISFKELQEMLSLNLTSRDLDLVRRLLFPIDLYNIRAIWLGAPLDERGYFKREELEEALLVGQDLPRFVLDFLHTYEGVEERLRYFSSLYASLYRDPEFREGRFLSQYTQMEREIRLVLTALRSKQIGRDVVRELQFEEYQDPLVAEIVAQKDAADYIPPKDYEDLKILFLENRSDPLALSRAILGYRFEKIEQMEVPSDFGIDRILSYIARLIIVESDLIEAERGKEEVEKLSQYG